MAGTESVRIIPDYCDNDSGMEMTMERVWHNNGFIIKSYEEQWPGSTENIDSQGVGRYVTWLLEGFNDKISISLSKEANERWFCYTYGLCAVPDLESI